MIGWVFIPPSERGDGPSFMCARCGHRMGDWWAFGGGGCPFCPLYTDKQAAKTRRVRGMA